MSSTPNRHSLVTHHESQDSIIIDVSEPPQDTKPVHSPTAVDPDIDLELQDVDMAELDDIDPDDKTVGDNLLTSDTSTSKLPDGDLLQIRGKGLIGLIEGIPLSVKLIFVGVIVLLGFASISSFLLAVEVKELQNTDRVQRFSSATTLMTSLVDAIQEERNLMTLSLLQGHNLTTSTEKDMVFAQTNQWIIRATPTLFHLLGGPSPNETVIATNETYYPHVAQQYVDNYALFIDNLHDVRAEAVLGMTSAKTVLVFYSDAVDSLTAMLTILSQRSNYAVTKSLVELVKLKELCQQIRAQGQNTIISNKITYDTGKELLRLINQRDVLTSNWIQGVDHIHYVTYLEQQDSELSSALDSYESTMTKITLSRANCILPVFITFSFDQWTNGTTMVDAQLSVVKQGMNRQIANELNQTRKKARGLIGGAVALVGVFFLLVLAVLIVQSRSIIGPWVRVNTIQRLAVARFVPQPFIRLLGYDSLTDVAVGKSVPKKMTMLVIRPRKMAEMDLLSGTEEADERTVFLKSVPKTPSQKLFGIFHRSMSKISKKVMDKKGIITHQSAQGLHALFKSPLSAWNACAELKDDMSLSASIHTGDVSLGITGDESRMSPVVIGTEESLTRHLQEMAEQFGADCLMSKAALQKSPALLQKTHHRVIGNICHQDKLITIVQLFFKPSAMTDSDSLTKFRSALTAYAGCQFQSALSIFSALAEADPSDLVALHYVTQTRILLHEYKAVAGKMLIQEVLHNPATFKGMQQLCFKEVSTENINLWQKIREFQELELDSDRRLMAQDMIEKHFTRKGDEEMNTNQAATQKIKAGMQNYPLNPHLFDEIQKELEGLMGDTLNRYKQTNEFCKAVFATNERLGALQWFRHEEQ